MSATSAPTAPRNHELDGKAESPDSLIRRAHAAFTAQGMSVSPSRVSREVRKLLKAGRAPQAVLDELSYYALTYQDSTGETVVRRILREERA